MLFLGRKPQESGQESATLTRLPILDTAVSSGKKLGSFITKNVRTLVLSAAGLAAVGGAVSSCVNSKTQERQKEFDERFNEHMIASIKDLISELKRANELVKNNLNCQREFYFGPLAGINITQAFQPVDGIPTVEPFNSNVDLVPEAEGFGDPIVIPFLYYDRIGVDVDLQNLTFVINNDSYWSFREQSNDQAVGDNGKWRPEQLWVEMSYSQTAEGRPVPKVVSVKPLVPTSHKVQIPMESFPLPVELQSQLEQVIAEYFTNLVSYWNFTAPLNARELLLNNPNTIESIRKLTANLAFGAELKEGTVRLHLIDNQGKPFDCTAFVAAEDALVTAAHCFKRPNNPDFLTLDAITEYNKDGTDRLTPSAINVIQPGDYRVAIAPEEEDVALVSFKGFPMFSKDRVLPVTNAPLSNGLYLSGRANGYGDKERWQVEAGQVDLVSLERVNSDKNLPTMKIRYDFPNQPGNSGGPIVNAHGEVVSIHSKGNDVLSDGPVLTRGKVEYLKKMADAR